MSPSLSVAWGGGWLKRLHVGCVQAYRQGSYQAAFDLYNQLLDTAEPVSGVFHVLLIYCFLFAHGRVASLRDVHE